MKSALYIGLDPASPLRPGAECVSLSHLHELPRSRGTAAACSSGAGSGRRAARARLVPPRGFSRARATCRSTPRCAISCSERTGARPAGPIRLLTHLRYFGYSFNPVSFYYVFDATDTRVETIVAEITNTPWKERHAYVLPVAGAARAGGRAWRFSFEKQFHVSPFMPMDMRYDWRFGAPARGPARAHGELARRRGAASTPRCNLRAPAR